MQLKQIKSNFHMITLGNLSIWFSYETPIAFNSYGQIFIRENDWGATTGKHLNYISTDKKIRMNGEKFEQLLEHNIGILSPVMRAS